MQSDLNLTITTTISGFQLSQSSFQSDKSFAAPRDEM